MMNLYTVAHNLVKMTNIIFAAQAAADGIRSALYTHEFTAKEDEPDVKTEKVLALHTDVLRRLRRNEAPKRGVTARKWKNPASENANRPMPGWIATGLFKGDVIAET